MDRLFYKGRCGVLTPSGPRHPANIDLGRLRLDRSKESNMPASDLIFCFTSNNIDIHFCPNCRAPMLVRAGQDLSARTFECFNCEEVEVIPTDRPELAL
jgi:hypothetical protein